MVLTYRFLTAVLLWAGFPTSMLGQSKDFDGSHYSTEDWALPYRMLLTAALEERPAEGLSGERAVRLLSASIEIAFSTDLRLKRAH